MCLYYKLLIMVIHKAIYWQLSEHETYISFEEQRRNVLFNFIFSYRKNYLIFYFLKQNKRLRESALEYLIKALVLMLS